MPNTIYLRAPNNEGWSRAVNHFKSSHYHTEIGVKYQTLSVSISDAHATAAQGIIRQFGLQEIDRDSFLSPRVEPSKATRTEKPIEDQKELVCVCGYRSPTLRQHKAQCRKWSDYIWKHQDEIVKMAVEQNREKASKYWNTSPQTIALMMYSAGVLTRDELSPSAIKRIHRIPTPLSPASMDSVAKPTKSMIVPASTSDLNVKQIMKVFTYILDEYRRLKEEEEKSNNVVAALREQLNKQIAVNNGLQRRLDEASKQLDLLVSSIQNLLR